MKCNQCASFDTNTPQARKASIRLFPGQDTHLGNCPINPSPRRGITPGCEAEVDRQLTLREA